MRFSIRDILWLTVVVGFGAAWLQERHARVAAEETLRTEEFWSKALVRGIEAEGYFVAGAMLGTADLVRLPADFPKGLSPAEKWLRLRELMATTDDPSREK